MRLALLTADQRRHFYVARTLIAAGHNVQVMVCEEKGQAPKSAPLTVDDAIVADHFTSLRAAEERFFPEDSALPAGIAEVLRLPKGGINSPEVLDVMQRHKIEGVAVFGSSILKEPLLSLYAGRLLNIHQGLSPYYRGSGTNFWPFHERELQYVGVTLHYVDSGVDRGAILAHDRPKIFPHDRQHDIGCRTVQVSAELLAKALRLLDQGRPLSAQPQWQRGRLFTRADFNAQAVLRVRRLMAEGLVESYCGDLAAGLVPPVRLVELSVT